MIEPKSEFFQEREALRPTSAPFHPAEFGGKFFQFCQLAYAARRPFPDRPINEAQAAIDVVKWSRQPEFFANPPVAARLQVA